MSSVPIFFQGECLLLRWNESAKGRSVTLQLDPHVGEQHPFKTLKCGENGSRLMLVAVLIGDDELPAPAAAAQRSVATTVVPIKQSSKWNDLSPTAQAAICCDDPKFQEWLGVIEELRGTKAGSEIAANHVRSKCKVMSRSELATSPESAKLWDALHTDFTVRGYAR